MSIAGRGWLNAAALTLCLVGSMQSWATEATSIRTVHEISREQATQMLQERYGTAARVVRTDVIDTGGRHIYVFRLLSVSGKVWIVHIDAQSGAEVP